MEVTRQQHRSVSINPSLALSPRSAAAEDTSSEKDTAELTDLDNYSSLASPTDSSVSSPPPFTMDARPSTSSSSNYYSSDNPHHSLMESSYVKATSSPVLSSSTPSSPREYRKCILGICAMEKKTRSKPMTQILDRLRAYGEFIIIMFTDALLLDDSRPIETWPLCDCLISFSSKGFPLNKVIEYVKLRKPFCVNDVPSQTALLDRRQVYQILEQNKIPTPRHLYIDRTHLEQPAQAAQQHIADVPHAPLVHKEEHIESEVPPLQEFAHYVLINGHKMNKPLVEKPFDADDHNIYIYYPPASTNAASATTTPTSATSTSSSSGVSAGDSVPFCLGGGSRRLFRKVGNRSSRFYPKVNSLRRVGSYIYEELFLNGKDLKVYTIGPGYAHGEMRKSPVVDGIVERDPDKKELRLLTKLTEEEKQIAAQICVAFKQNICGFDIIRFQGRSYVIDVNGWSFVKGNQRYYDKCARILRKMCLGCRQGRIALSLADNVGLPKHLDLTVNLHRDKERPEEKKECIEVIDDDKEEESNGKSVMEIKKKTEPIPSLLALFSPPAAPINSTSSTTAKAATAPSPSSTTLPIVTSPASTASSPAINAAAASVPVKPLRSLSPRSLLACISNPTYIDPTPTPLSPLTLDAAVMEDREKTGQDGGGWAMSSGSAGHHRVFSNSSLVHPLSPSSQPISNIATAQNVIMDTDNNDVLRALVAVFRHADRTPKQKVKLKSKHSSLLSLFKVQVPNAKKSIITSTSLPVSLQTVAGASPTSSSYSISSANAAGASIKYTEIKMKKKEELHQLLQIIKVMILREKLRMKKKAKEKERDKETTSNSTNPSMKDKLKDPKDSRSSTSSPLPSLPGKYSKDKDDDDDDLAAEAELAEMSDADIMFVDGTTTDDDLEKAWEKEMMEREKKESQKDPDYLPKLLQVATVLERGYGGVKVQIKPKKVEDNRVTQVLLVCKWGGEMTHAGIGQAKQYAAAFWDDCCPPPPIPTSFFLQPQAQAAEKDKAKEKEKEKEREKEREKEKQGEKEKENEKQKAKEEEQKTGAPSLPSQQRPVTMPIPRSDSGTPDSTNVMVDHNSTLDQADRDRYKKMLSDVQQIRDRSASPSLDKTALATPTAISGLASGVSPPSTPFSSASFTDAIKSGFKSLLRAPSALMSRSNSPVPGGSSSPSSVLSPHLVNTSVSDTAAASALVNPLLQRELDKYREKQEQFVKQRIDFISGMQIYSSDENRVVESARAFYTSTLEHAHGIGETQQQEPNNSNSAASNSSAPGGSGNKKLKDKEVVALVQSFKASADANIHHDKQVLSYLDDTSLAMDAMARAKAGVSFLLMAENLFTPAQVTRHMLAVEQMSRATSEAERSRIEREEAEQIKKAKEEAEIREKQERVRAERKKQESREQEIEEKLLDEQAQQEEDPIYSTIHSSTSEGGLHTGIIASTPVTSNGVIATMQSMTKEKKDKAYKKGRPTELQQSMTLPAAGGAFPSPTSSPRLAPVSPPPYSPPPSPSSFEPNAMTAWGVRCLRWIGKPRDTLHHLYILMKQLQTQIHNKCQFAKVQTATKDTACSNTASTTTSTTSLNPSSAARANSIIGAASANAASSEGGSAGVGGSGSMMGVAQSSPQTRSSADVFEYVFEAGDEEIVGTNQKIKRPSQRRFAAEYLLCHGETLFLLKTRWDRLITSFYDPVSRSYDPTKVPDVYDCFTANDTRVLTDRGLLFVDEIEAHLSRGEAVLYACFEQSGRLLRCNEDAMKGKLVYCTGELVFPYEATDEKPHPPPPPTDLLVFNSSPAEEEEWRTATMYSHPLCVDVDDDITDDVEVVDGQRIYSRHLSLRVTPTHHMFAQQGNRVSGHNKIHYRTQMVNGKQINRLPCRVTAADLYAAGQADELASVRMLGCATDGRVPSALEVSHFHSIVCQRLSLDDKQLLAFLELFGFYLGSGTLMYRAANGSGANAVRFAHCKSDDDVFVKARVAAAGLQYGQQWTASSHTLPRADPKAKVKIVYTMDVIDPVWFAFFDESFGPKHRRSVHYDSAAVVERPGNKRRRDDKENVSPADVKPPTTTATPTPTTTTTTDDTDPDKPTKSVKWLPSWVISCLTPVQLRLVIRGLWRAVGTWSGAKEAGREEEGFVKRIYTSCAAFRDQLMQALLHCGCSPSCRLFYPAGTINGYMWHDQRVDKTVYRVSYVNKLSPTDRANFTPITATTDGWAVDWCEPVGHNAKASCWPNMRIRESITRTAYSKQRDGRIWCVSVNHPQHVIVAQRAVRRDDDGVVIKQSRPVMVGNCIKYDVLHNSEFITEVRPLYSAIKRVADCVVPQEYGVLRKDKWSIGVNIAKPLFSQIISNLENGLLEKPAQRVVLYFSSESHIHALRNVLLLCGIAANRTVATTLDAIELNYLSHAVFRLYEDLSMSLQHPLRFYVNVQFSPGAALDPFIFAEPGHALPVSRPVPVHGRIPFNIFKQLFSNLPSELPAVKPYLEVKDIEVIKAKE